MAERHHNVDVDRLTRHYQVMCRIRAFETAAEQAQADGKVGGAIHLSIGQEAIAAGVCGNLRTSDQITTTHRGHGHCIAKGTDPEAMMLELFGRDGGTCGGKGGSMHIADFSVVTWSAMVHEAMAAAEIAAEAGLDIEVIDLRTLWPWDRETVFRSVARTGRLIVAQEAVRVGGFGAEIAASVAEALAGDLKAPVRRLGAPRAPISYSRPLEDRLRVTASKIAKNAKELLAA